MGLGLEWLVSDALLFDDHAGIVVGYAEAVTCVLVDVGIERS